MVVHVSEWGFTRGRVGSVWGHEGGRMEAFGSHGCVWASHGGMRESHAGVGGSHGSVGIAWGRVGVAWWRV